MPLFPNHETPPTKKILLYILAAVVICIILAYILPGGELPEYPQ